jgi:hypothetical protein
MTADAFAVLVHAQRTGTGRWKARCPAHNDQSPSLSIREGDDGRVLMLCRAGCSLDSILTALKLGKRDLFAGPPPSAQQTAVLVAATLCADKRCNRRLTSLPVPTMIFAPNSEICLACAISAPYDTYCHSNMII